jgi:hypothetical protein
LVAFPCEKIRNKGQGQQSREKDYEKTRYDFELIIFEER